ncbi:MAG: translocation/assembly module TamB domain-containing protein [Armatimonadetes bacterium]|nr:translocation/assembly module TamB domain-containing protein [Armatimonadota bacterium]
MTSRRKLVIALITYVPVLVMVIASGLYVVRQFSVALQNANLLLIDEFARRLNREVQIGRATVTPLGVAILDDVEIASGKKLAAGKMVVARRIIIRYNTRALLFGGRGAQAIRKVEVLGPRVNLVRRTDGTFNVQDLLKRPPGPPGPPFLGQVTITNGTVIFQDFLTRSTPIPAINRFTGVDAFVDAGRQPIYSFSASGRGERGRFASARAVGMYNSITKSVNLDVNADRVSAAYWTAYLGLSRSVKVHTGTLEVAAGVRVRRAAGRSRMAAAGVIKVTNASASLSIFREPVKGITGNIVLADQRLILSLAGSLANSGARVAGEISGFTKPRLDLVVTSPDVDFPRLLRVANLPASARQFQPRGRGPARATVMGAASAPIVDVSARIPSVVARGYTVRDVAVSALYGRGELGFRSLEFTMLGGRVSAAGTLSLTTKPRVSIQGHAERINLAGLPLPPDLQAAGIASVDFSIRGPLSDIQVSANADVSRGQFAGVPVRRVTTGFSYANGRLVVSNFRASGGTVGTIAVAGSVSGKAIDLSVSAQGANITSLARLLGLEGVGGVGYFKGRIAGAPDNPTVSGAAEVFQGRYGGYDVDYARLLFSGEKRAIRVTEGIVRLFPAEIRFSGSVRGIGTRRVPFNLTGSVDRLTVGKLSSLIGRKIDMTGTVSGAIQASGTYAADTPPGRNPFMNTKASADLRLEDGTAFDLPIDNAHAKLKLTGTRLDVSDAVMTSEKATLTVSGSTFLDTKALDLTFDLTGFDLARVRDRVKNYANIAGTARARGNVTGKLEDLRAVVNAAVDNLTINGKRYDQAELSLAYGADVISNMAITLSRGSQSLSLNAADYVIKTNCLGSASARISGINIPDVWQLLTSSPYLRTEQGRSLQEAIRRVPRLTSGTLSGTIALDGCLNQPNGTLSLHASNVGVDIREIKSIDIDATATNGIVTLSRLSAASDDTSVTATGEFVIPDRRVRLDVVASNLDLSRLRPWLGDNTPTGVARADLLVEGNVTSPHVVGSVEVVKPGYGVFTFDALRASRVEVTDRRIEFSDVIVASNSHQAVARGYLPWSWSTFSIPPNEPLEMSVSLQKQDLSLLSALTTELDPARTSGAIQAAVQVGGTFASPEIGGSLRIDNGTVALKNFTNDFNKVNVDLRFDGNRVVVDELSATSSLGGRISVLPGGYVTMGRLADSPADLRIVADGLILAERNAVGFGEDISTQIDAGLSVTGTLASPLVADAKVGDTPAGITISNARFAFVAPQGFMPPLVGKYVIDPQFDVGIRVGRDVWVAPPNAALRVQGDGTIMGRLSKPEVGLVLTIAEGNIRLAATRLRVLPGGEIYAAYTPPAEPELRVDFKAVTSVTATSALGRRQRYTITLAVSGQASNLQVNMTSSPAGLSREQMLAALGHVEGIFAGGESELQRELGNILTAVGSSTLFAPVETLFVERLGFEQFTLEYGPTQPLALYVSRRLFNNIYLSYYGRLSSQYANVQDVNYELGIGYRFSDRYQFSVGVDDQQTSTVQMQYTSNF